METIHPRETQPSPPFAPIIAQGLLGRLGEQRRELARVLSQYGRVGVCVYTGLSLTSLGASLLAVKTGIGLDSCATASASVGLLEELTLAYVLHKTTLPVRIPLTVALTPAASRKIKTLSLLVQRRFG